MNADTLLLRQVHPNWVRDERATSQSFHPTPKDNHRLSVHDGDQTTPEAAWRRYTLEWESEGVVAVTVEECQQNQLPVIADPLPDSPEHALIDFTGLTGRHAKRIARQLARAANARGWLYRPQASYE